MPAITMKFGAYIKEEDAMHSSNRCKKLSCCCIARQGKTEAVASSRT